MTVATSDKGPPSRLRRWVITPVLNQLKQGTSPEKLSWSISLGITLGIFPIMGSTSLVCFLAGYFLKLNQPLLHLFKTFTYPFHIAFIIIFIRLGQRMNGVAPLEFSIKELVAKFRESPLEFAGEFGMAALYGIEAWAMTSVLLIPLIYYISLPILKRLSRKRQEAVTIQIES
ncbi:DUF2062 domain-containing protein [Luteolibacter algae]|uniref:DUF2062 domain-containing protein n=1 Tax=Luteolibacter algae TaxID=454151 RepID=A0ABW5D3V3_9BACT